MPLKKSSAPAVLICKKCMRLVRFLGRLLLLITGIWCLAAMPPVLKLPETMRSVFSIALIILFAGSFLNRHALILLIGVELTFLLYFILLTPEIQFDKVKFERVFAVKPSIKYLPDGKFEVINLRNNRYSDDYSEASENYQDVFKNELFDPSAVTSMQLIQVYWGNMDYVAHTMFNFKFADGRQLTVSVEPRTPIGVDRKTFTHLCRQHELLIILSVPEDIITLRSNIRGEDVYLYDFDLPPEKCRIFLEQIIAKVDRLNRNPEFYDLIKANCLTALLPALKTAVPELKEDFRGLFNGYFDRMLFEQGLLKKRDGESFESLKSRSFVKGKSQGKL